MPYISPKKRGPLDPLIDALIGKIKDLSTIDGPENPINCGDLNYVITRLLAGSFDIGTKPKYRKINDIVGILECVKLEFYNRVAVSYEQKCISENGDVKEYLDFNILKGSWIF